jgi:hypothetical protein
MRYRRRRTHQKAPVEELVTVAVVGQVSEVLEGPRLVLWMAGDRLGHDVHDLHPVRVRDPRSGYPQARLTVHR